MATWGLGQQYFAGHTWEATNTGGGWVTFRHHAWVSRWPCAAGVASLYHWRPPGCTQRTYLACTAACRLPAMAAAVVACKATPHGAGREPASALQTADPCKVALPAMLSASSLPPLSASIVLLQSAWWWRVCAGMGRVLARGAGLTLLLGWHGGRQQVAAAGRARTRSQQSTRTSITSSRGTGFGSGWCDDNCSGVTFGLRHAGKRGCHRRGGRADGDLAPGLPAPPAPTHE